MMALVDTSVWVDYLRHDDDVLADLLTRGLVVMHSMIVGELACGNLKNRNELMNLWQDLPVVCEATHDEVLSLLQQKQLMGQGIGYVDLHLLAATLLTSETRIWTRDKRLNGLAESLDVAFVP